MDGDGTVLKQKWRGQVSDTLIPADSSDEGKVSSSADASWYHMVMCLLISSERLCMKEIDSC